LGLVAYEKPVMDTPSVSQQRVTDLLTRWSDGEDAALAELTPLVYEELRRLAHRQMGGERPDHTLQTTALVNEAYLRLADQANPNWQSRAHTLASTTPKDVREPIEAPRGTGFVAEGAEGDFRGRSLGDGESMAGALPNVK